MNLTTRSNVALVNSFVNEQVLYMIDEKWPMTKELRILGECLLIPGKSSRTLK